MPIVMRMIENTYYSAFDDMEMIRFMAVTNHGSFHAEIPELNSKFVRECRQRFKQRAAEMYQRGVMPCEVELGDYDG